MTTRVVVADDEPMIRTVLRKILDAEPDICVVGEAENGRQAVELAGRLRPDVLLMDVRMPELDGLDATELILDIERQPPRILLLTIFDSDQYVYRALCAGATGFLLKRAEPEQIVHAVRVAALGDTLLFPASIRELAARYRPRRPLAISRQLTEREADVLRLMAQGLTNSEIAERLYITVGTVKTHIGNLLTKLNARDRTQAVIAAYESGFITPGP
ncbi:DNA-binding NarL/FixJ family response regulator [Thermocatellispora tengchongensis]|uniref:DNA-binding NarL/FixJ family response regulator n=1 Tax=Thermocatellispora tengchongensis TaxID=1073253 RepID=A0A840P0K3_9ACTN|nr:response regulator transcription factor [Thermocatellispora tengchongensis]MBB5132912.1 DNA-binding NarL/FixJ family response regulator [Thermocatellispora tengchongensis]